MLALLLAMPDRVDRVFKRTICQSQIQGLAVVFQQMFSFRRPVVAVAEAAVVDWILKHVLVELLNYPVVQDPV